MSTLPLLVPGVDEENIPSVWSLCVMADEGSPGLLRVVAIHKTSVECLSLSA